MTEPQSIDMHEAQSRLPELVALAKAGADIILTEGAMPVVRLVAVSVPLEPRVAGLHAGAMSLSADFDEPLPEDYWSGTP